MRFGFYYSHAFDWEHPDAPGNDWDYNQPGGDKLLHGATQWYEQHPEMLERAKNYVDKKAIPQLLKLIKNYQPDILWFDTSGKLASTWMRCEPSSPSTTIASCARAPMENPDHGSRTRRRRRHRCRRYHRHGPRRRRLLCLRWRPRRRPRTLP
jgi:hypothetical protein